uniref:Uncharacterized protein n=1 Tax=Meloidogyne enterolobii TaxID=390850 RepID=A0A6V7XH86_MELEN|nr:unnamed protein product [Meloidogyne enterolobii]
MSSGPIRKMIVPAIRQLKTNLNEATNIITAQQEVLEEQQLQRLRTLRKQLASNTVRLENLNREWQDFMRKMKRENLPAEERIYENFQRPAPDDPLLAGYKHFTEWVVEVLAIIDTIDEIVKRDSTSGNLQSRTRSRSASIRSRHSHHSQRPNQQELPRNPAYDSFKIAPMEIPKFSGEPEKWTSFWQCFELAIHDNPNIPDALKVHHLCNSLMGSAESTIQGYPRIAENYPIIVECLKGRYGSTRNLRETLQSELLQLPPTKDTADSLRTFCDNIERICRQLECNFSTKEDASLLVTTIKAKLPSTLIEKIIERERSSPAGDWTHKELRNFLLEQVAIREEVEICTKRLRVPSIQREYSQPTRQSKSHRPAHSPSSNFTRTFTAIERNVGQCSLCTGDHLPSVCRKFQTPESRKTRLQAQRRCLNCLREGHKIGQCTSTKRCRNCGGKHHFIICTRQKGEQYKRKISHPTKQKNNYFRGNENLSPVNSLTHRPPQVYTNSRTNSENQPGTNQNVPANPEVAMTATGSKPHTFLMTCKLKLSSGNNRPIYTTVGLWDTGSQTSYISQSLVDRLRPPRVSTSNHSVRVFGADKVKFRSTGHKIRLHKPNGRWEEAVFCSIPQIVPAFPCIQWDGTRIPTNHRDLKNIPVKNREPEILLGVREFWRFFLGSRKIGRNLHIIKTHFGSMLCGELPHYISPTSLTCISLSAVHSSPEEMPASNKIEQFWNLESMGITDNPGNRDDEIATRLVDQSIKQDPDERYTVGLPWKSPEGTSGPPSELPSNFDMAAKRLSSVSNRIERAPTIAQEYHDAIEDQLKLEVIETAQCNTSAQKHILPHHAGSNKGKIRLLYDAIAHRKGLPSLNQTLFRGLVSLANLINQLLIFRETEIPVLADIEKACHQISLIVFCKLLWLKNMDQPLSPSNLAVYRFNGIAFGTISFPYILAAANRHHLSKERTALFLSKNCFRPLKANSKLTLPRLELLGILIGFNSTKFIQNEINWEIDKSFIWSDTTIALSWLKETVHQPVFIANRAKQIRTLPNSDSTAESKMNNILINTGRFHSWDKIRTTIWVLRFLKSKFIKPGREPSLLIKNRRPELLSISQATSRENSAFSANDYLTAGSMLINIAQQQTINVTEHYPLETAQNGLLPLKPRAQQIKRPALARPILPKSRSQTAHKGKRLEIQSAPRIGEILIVEEKYTPKDLWPMERIAKLGGKPGATRRVQIKPQNGNTVTRPVNSVYPLEIKPTEQEFIVPPQVDTATEGTQETSVRDPKTNAGHRMTTRSKSRALVSTLLNVTSLIFCFASINGSPQINMTCPKCQFLFTKKGVTIISPSEFANLELCCAGNCLIKRNAPVNSGTLSGSGLLFLLLLSIGLSRMLKSCSPQSNSFFQSSPLYFKLLSAICDFSSQPKSKGKIFTARV